MTAVRVVATLTFDTQEKADQAVAAMIVAHRPKRQEEGCLQYELMRSIENPLKVVLHELWASKPLYDQHWLTQMAREGAPNPDRLSVAKLEFYEYAEYVLLDDVWQPADPAQRLNTVRWA